MMSWRKKKEIRLRYDTEANGYDELYSDEQRKKFEFALRRLALRREDRILDCGCGTGMFLKKVAGSVQFAVGVDLSPKMLHRAQLRLGELSNIALICADFDFLPFSKGAFRCVFMFTALLGPTYWDDTIKEALRVLGTHGIMTLSVLKKETSSEKLLGKLRMHGLEPRGLIDDDTNPDYVVISKRPTKL